MKSTTQPPTQSQRFDIVPAVAIALLVYVGLSMADAWIAMPLRSVSTNLAYLGLKMMGLPIELQGVIMTTPNLVFEVVPACSGSTTLRVLLFLGVIWFSLQPGWDLGRRTLGALIAIPLAIAANSVRLAWLAGVGHLRKEPLEGLAHEWTGLIAFAVGALGIVAVTHALRLREHKDTNRRVGARIALTTAIAVLALATFLPFFHWTWLGWKNSPLDRLGPIYTGSGAVLGVVALAILRNRRPDAFFPQARVNPTFVVTSLIALGLYILALIADIRIVLGGAFGVWLISLASLRLRPWAVVAMIPFVALLALGAPTVPYALNTLLSRVAGVATSTATGQFTQMTLAAVMALVGLASLVALVTTRKRAAPVLNSDSPTRYRVSAKVATIATLVLAIGFRTVYSDSSLGGRRQSRLEMSYQLESWQGRPETLAQTIDGWRQGENFWSRTYVSAEDQSVVGALVVSSEGNRHNLHPPEYCFTGSGWSIASTKLVAVPFGDNPQSPVTRIRAQRGDKELAGLYWYTDGEITLPDYGAVILEDLKRRMVGKTTVWFFFRLLGSDHETLETQFLPSMTGALRVNSESYSF